MAKVTGLGGVFFKSVDPQRLYAWYEAHLGLKREEGGVMFRWRDAAGPATGMTVWALFENKSDYFKPSTAPFMLNYRVDDLDALLAQLRAAGVAVDDRREDGGYGKFAWLTDPDGNRVELWEPPAES